MFESIERLKKDPKQPNQSADRGKQSPHISLVQLEDKILVKSPSYFFISENLDDRISNVSASLKDIHGLNPKNCDYSDLVNRIHPEDRVHYHLSLQFRMGFFCTERKTQKINQYNHSIFFRIRIKSGEFKVINQQALVVEMQDNGQIQKSLIIHTLLEHIYPSKKNILKLNYQEENPKLSLLLLTKSPISTFEVSKRELEIIQLIHAGFENIEISNKLFISLNTVKKHRSNILKKALCNNTAQLLNKCISEGII